MIYKYEMACKYAGLSDEATAEIRRFFDAEKKKLKRDKAYREAKGITFSYLYPSEEDSEETGDLACRELVDENADVEETTMQKLLLEQLNDALDELSDDDREFLLFMFSGYGSASACARKLGVYPSTVLRRRDALIQKLRKSFFEKN